MNYKVRDKNHRSYEVRPGNRTRPSAIRPVRDAEDDYDEDVEDAKDDEGEELTASEIASLKKLAAKATQLLKLVKESGKKDDDDDDDDDDDERGGKSKKSAGSSKGGSSAGAFKLDALAEELGADDNESDDFSEDLDDSFDDARLHDSKKSFGSVETNRSSYLSDYLDKKAAAKEDDINQAWTARYTRHD